MERQTSLPMPVNKALNRDAEKETLQRLRLLKEVREHRAEIT